MKIQFVAYGLPKPAGSKRGFPIKRKNGSIGVAIVDACKDTKSWQHVVASAAREAYNGPLLDGALVLTCCFYMPRIKGDFNSKGGLKPKAPSFHLKKPDTTKLVRAVEDALSDVVWRDDVQVVQQFATKNYGEPARVEVLIQTLSPQ